MANSSTTPVIWKSKGRYGVTEQKKAEIDALALDVISAQYAVNNFQSIVNSLSDKVNNFTGFLATADTTRTTTYNNKLLINQLVQSSDILRKNAAGATTIMQGANTDTQVLGSCVQQVVNKLIYSVEVLNKLSNIIIRKKAVNPLISDDLISMIATAASDANNAIALTLVALQSTFAAEASNMESFAAIQLADEQAGKLYFVLTGTNDIDTKVVVSLKSMLYTAYDNAVVSYKRIQKALGVVTDQLSDATKDLAKAQVKLASLQAGLAAANAAALA